MRKLVMLFLSGVFVVLPTVAFADFSVDNSGLSETTKAGYGSSIDISTVSLPTFIGTYVIQPVLGITGTLLFALMTYAGFLWTTAQGDPKRVQKAKDILTQCIVGTVILVCAYALSTFVISSLTPAI